MSRCMHEVHAAGFAQIHRCKLCSCPGVTRRHPGPPVFWFKEGGTLRCFRSSDKKNAGFYMKVLLLRGNNKCFVFVWIEACACESSGYTQITAHIRVVFLHVCGSFVTVLRPVSLHTAGQHRIWAPWELNWLSSFFPHWSSFRIRFLAVSLIKTLNYNCTDQPGSRLWKSGGGSRRLPCIEDGGRGALWDLKYCTHFSVPSFTYSPVSEDNSLDFTAWVCSLTWTVSCGTFSRESVCFFPNKVQFALLTTAGTPVRL